MYDGLNFTCTSRTEKSVLYLNLRQCFSMKKKYIIYINNRKCKNNTYAAGPLGRIGSMGR